jgi:hypothetical protein
MSVSPGRGLIKGGYRGHDAYTINPTQNPSGNNRPDCRGRTKPLFEAHSVTANNFEIITIQQEAQNGKMEM